MSVTSDAAADLDRNAHPFHNVSDLAKICRFSTHGAVEVHYVDSAGPEAFPHAGLRTWVFVEDRRGVHIALAEPDALAVFEINGGDNNHRETGWAE